MSKDAGISGEVIVDAYLVYYGGPSRSLDWTCGLAKAFSESHPGYQVRIHGSDFRSVPRDVFRAVRDGHPPAIAQFSYTSVQLARDMSGQDGRPLFRPVEPAVGGRTQILGQPVTHTDIHPALRDYYSYEGALVSVPTQVSTLMLYANMTLLEAAGITAIPQTWADISAACKALSDLRGAPSHAITWPNYGWMFQHAVAAQGGLLTDHDNGRSGRATRLDLASAEMIAYADWWRELHENGYYLYTSRPNPADPVPIWAENLTAFATQQVALSVSTSVLCEQMVQAGRDGGFDVRVGRAPCNGEVPYHGSALGGDSLWLANGLDKATEDGAIAFIQYLNEPEIVAERHKATGYEPATRGSVDLLDDQGWFAEQPHRRAAIDELTTARGSAHAKAALLGNFTGISYALVGAMHDVLADGTGPAARFAEANREAQRLLDDYNARLGPALDPTVIEVD